ncbi:hypothetical protein [Leclercia adecarboxylata]|uniref:hypothetical protein n=1 Tax=Leclercia adecarboxylata TaxID=83655 RepID=UPI00057A4EE7|nr:hypothetical protein [Leclercia adecarboxylata]
MELNKNYKNMKLTIQMFHSLIKVFLWLPAQNVSELLPITIALTAKKMSAARRGIITSATMVLTVLTALHLTTRITADLEVVERNYQLPLVK